MSKKRSKKKKSPAAGPKKKKIKVKNIVITACVIAAAAVACAVVYIIYLNTSLSDADFAGKMWRSTSAYDSSGDEADLKTIYNNYYRNYRGSLKLKDDGTFSFWMSVGDPTDGTHSGSYTYDRDKDIVNAVFDSGDKADFKIVRDKNKTIEHIEAPYNGYTIYFTLEEDSTETLV